ncbi:MAG: ATP-dependent zinc metalloprotease FtsH [Oscillospiraceae bacterium]|nr:ATP-dependent zinc metalloprotease FtsH [Oscillospiraceae bacterium]
MTYLIISLIVTCLLNVFISVLTSPNKIEVNYSDFMQMLEADEVDEVELQSAQILIKRKKGLEPWKPSEPENADNTPPPSPSPSFEDEFLSGVQLMNKYMTPYQIPKNVIYYTGNVHDPKLIEKLDKHKVNYFTKIPNLLMNIFQTWILPILIMLILFSVLMSVVSKKFGGRGGFMSFGESNAKVYMENKTGITFADVAGQEEAKESLNEIVDFLHNPARYTEIGARQPKGALLVGPPGTGKTLLAKAVAGEASVPFFSISGSDFVEMFVGVGASRVRDLFKQASAKAPCIIFIDEVDAIGKSRDTHHMDSEHEQTLNQLLSEMDGFDSSKGVIILAATNRPETLDKALLRPGRFDRRIIVEKPDLKGREDILKVHSKNIKTEDDIDLHEIALATSGAVGADLANMVNEAALGAVRSGRKKVSQSDLMEAVEVIIAGKEKKDRILSEKEKRIVAFHEVGHALAAALQKNTKPVQKITIVPRTMGALGYTMQMPEEEHYLMSKDEIIEQIIVYLAGRCAEDIGFDTITTGAANDIEQATSLARSMVAQYGMSEKFGMAGLESIQSKYLDGRPVANCSETTLAEIDKEVIIILKDCYKTAENLLKSNMEALKRIAEFLVEKENITGDEFMKILNEVRGIPDPCETEDSDTAESNPDKSDTEEGSENTDAPEIQENDADNPDLPENPSFSAELQKQTDIRQTDDNSQ